MMLLVAMLDEYGDEVCADLLSEYGIWLPDIIWGKVDTVMDAAAVLTLVRKLPEGSRYAGVFNQDDPGWDRERFYLMDAANQLRSLVFMYQQVHSKSSPPPPKYWEPPGVSDATAITVDETESMANEQAFLEEQARRLAEK